MTEERLAMLIGRDLAKCHTAGECYIANVRCGMQTHEEHYVAAVQAAYGKWIEAMRACVEAFDRVNAAQL